MKNFTRSFFALIVLVFAGWQATAASVTISVMDFSFNPSDVSINAGDDVNFQWVNGVHTATSDNGSWTSLSITSSNPSQTLTLGPGSYPYHCSFHGAAGGVGMSGTITVRSISGMKDMSKPLYFSVYPNPTNGQARIAFTGKNSEVCKVLITNAVGSVVQEINLNQNNADLNAGIDISNLPSGLYFCNLLANDKMIETRRLILQRE